MVQIYERTSPRMYMLLLRAPTQGDTLQKRLGGGHVVPVRPGGGG